MASGVALSHDISRLYTGGFKVTQKQLLAAKLLMYRLKDSREVLIYVSTTLPFEVD